MPPENAIHSLAVQARCLASRVETHLLGNHLFANGKALVFAGLFFTGEEARGWFAKGLEILRREVPEQVLVDGGHFERSPMYHSLILEDLLDLVNLARLCGDDPESFRIPVREWEEAAVRMVAWLRAMCHPDGEIALFNDSVFGIAPTPEELFSYASRLGLDGGCRPSRGVTHLKESGYIRIQEESAVLFLDVGPLGPDYQPGHGHADTLSFELSVNGQRVIVDTGTSQYDESPERLFERGTAAHNTVVVDGQDSSEVWGSFRVARRAMPFGLRVVEEKGATIIECSHDGYRRLPGKVTHCRVWNFGKNTLVVEDRLESRFASARFGLLLDPAVARASKAILERGETSSVGGWKFPCGATIDWRLEPGSGRHEAAEYHPEFGLSNKTVRLAGDFAGNRNRIEIGWF